MAIAIRNLKSAEQRRLVIEKQTNTKLTNIGHFSLDEKIASSKNCENMIGIAQVPMGIAGPLKVKSEKFKIQTYYIPLATTEGALVASISRGSKAIAESGGANAFAFRVGQTRGPVFTVDSIKKQHELYLWIEDNQDKLKKITELTSKHLKFKKAKVKSLANYSFVRFYFDTQDAMGMNMVTIATQKAVELIEKETGVRCLSVAGNYDIDKKPSWLNFIENRGFKVWAEVDLKKDVIRDILKVSAEKFYDVWLGKCMLGSAMSGSLGFNAQYANVLAAMFIATGQDPAHVVEGSLGITSAKILKSGNLSVSIYLPSLQVGTLGGGTELNTQREALKIMGVKGEGKVEKFAEIIGATVLAGEISLISSLAEGTLARAHERLGR